MSQISPMAWLVVGIFLVMLTRVLIAVISSRKVKRPAAPEIATATKPEQKPPGYTYKDFARDLSDENVDIASIMERCKGALPPEPEPVREGPRGADGGQGGGIGVPGGPPPLGLDGGPAARVSEKLPAALDRQAWFAQLAQQLPKLNIVTPPAPQVVIAVKGMPIPCQCRSGLSTSPSERYSSPQRGPFRPEVQYYGNAPGAAGSVKSPKCEKCNDTGVVISLGGK